MSENKIARIPIASHGLHRHKYNYPWLSSINFGDVMPCYINTLRKGERDQPKAGMYSQLMPIAHNAFATGRYNFKAIFVPYKFVWRPWYSFDQQTPYNSNGNVSNPTVYPFIGDAALSDAFLKMFGDNTASGNSYDVISCHNENGVLTPHYWFISNNGRRVLRVLGALGCMPSFDMTSTETLNILAVMCYIKAFADYYFPNNYVGNIPYQTLLNFFDTDTIDFSSTTLADALCNALSICSLNFYENSIFDLAWDNPVSPNVNSAVPSVKISDSSSDATYSQIVTNNPSAVTSPSTSAYKPNNGTPFVGGNASGSTVAGGVLTKYVIDALESVSLWAKRHQLSGARLLDRFLVSRGLTLGNDSARISYLVGQRNIEIQVSGVENNTDVNLGELAGRGIASSGDNPLSFECKPEDDGVFLVIVSPLPDSNFPILTDGFSVRKDYMDNYHSEFDKLGSAAISSRVIQMSLNGMDNQHSVNTSTPFGFLNQYWDEIQERPRLLGDFILQARGSEQLSAYHTFRLLSTHNQRFHSFSFVRMNDSAQYQRLFYSEDQENLMLFLRWYGSQYKEKLPIGDSFEWDDDELNRKVSVVIGGSQK